MKKMKWLEENLELMILAAFLIVMSVLSFTNVIMRYCFHHALSWSDEICCYCLALSAFFSLPCAIRMGSSIKVDTFAIILPKPIQKGLEVICNVAMLVFLAVLLKGTMGIIRNAAKIGQASPALQIPLAWIYSVMGAAVILACFRYVQALTRMLHEKGQQGEKEEKT